MVVVVAAIVPPFLVKQVSTNGVEVASAGDRTAPFTTEIVDC